MLPTALLAAAESGINRVLRLDPTALARLDRLSGQLIEVDCTAPAWRLFVMADGEGLRLAAHWEGEPDCRLRAPASALLRLATTRQKTAVLHRPDVILEGDTAPLMSLAEILQDLNLDWEYELSRLLGPLGTALFASGVRRSTGWARDSGVSLRHDLADYLNEESRLLVGREEAEARFAELDDLKLDLDRLEARLNALSPSEPRETE